MIKIKKPDFIKAYGDGYGNEHHSIINEVGEKMWQDYVRPMLDHAASLDEHWKEHQTSLDKLFKQAHDTAVDNNNLSFENFELKKLLEELSTTTFFERMLPRTTRKDK